MTQISTRNNNHDKIIFDLLSFYSKVKYTYNTNSVVDKCLPSVIMKYNQFPYLIYSKYTKIHTLIYIMPS